MKTVSSKPLPIIEYDEAGRHRIVVQDASGKCVASSWTPVTEDVRLGNLYAGGAGSPFEEALFTIRAVSHQVLT